MKPSHFLVLSAASNDRSTTDPLPSTDTVLTASTESKSPLAEGDEFRAESDTGDHASALVFDESVVHGSVVAAA
jgi:hypothetical protein